MPSHNTETFVSSKVYHSFTATHSYVVTSDSLCEAFPLQEVFDSSIKDSATDDLFNRKLLDNCSLLCLPLFGSLLLPHPVREEGILLHLSRTAYKVMSKNIFDNRSIISSFIQTLYFVVTKPFLFLFLLWPSIVVWRFKRILRVLNIFNKMYYYLLSTYTEYRWFNCRKMTIIARLTLFCTSFKAVN